MGLKAKAAQQGTSSAALCSQMLENSELAWALKEVYEKISNGRVAGIRLSGMDMSLQISSKANDSEREHELGQHSGLLLLEDKDSLLRDLSHPDASPLAYFIREHTPTKSLQKQAIKLGIPVNDILYLAHHLIKWRKARAIPTLHPRNVYVVGPEAPLDRLEDYAVEYGRLFSALPSLLQVLKILSGRPLKYGMLIPSRDHRAPYMDILAYLVRCKFVVQLKTSGWLQAPTEPKKKTKDVEINKNRRPVSVASLLSPQLRPVDDDTASVSSERTAIPVSTVEAATKQSGKAKRVEDQAEEHGNSQVIPRIIANPSAPPKEDAEGLQRIIDSIEDEELCDRLPSLYRYFNGEAALEEIAAMEGLKRSRLETWLDQLQADGILMTFRHR